jgi:cyclophilin family peptidyl-prolyl cis-trans isomerase
MASIGVNTNGSQFYISLSPTYYMNGRCIVFGRLIEGESILARMEKVYTYRLVPSNDIVISSCGIIEPSAASPAK